MGRIEARLRDLKIELPSPPKPVASYVPAVSVAALVFISGQVSSDAAGGVRGRVGAGLSLEDGQRAARLCGLNLLAQMKAACGGDLDRVKKVVKITGFINVASDFDPIPNVMNGCSDLMVEVFGEAGRHARSAVGVANLPLGFAAEADCVFELD